MAVAGFLAGAAERDILQHRDIVLDHRRLADYHASTMVDHDAAAEACGRMDVDVEDFRGPALQQEGHGLTVLVPPPVGETMGLERQIGRESCRERVCMYC